MNILWLKSEYLHPVDKGGRIRTYSMLRALARRNDITYLTLDEGAAAPDAPALAAEYSARAIGVPLRTVAKSGARFYLDLAANCFSSLPYVLWKYRSPAFRSAYESTLKERPVDIVVCDFLTPSVSLPRRVAVPTLLFQHNVEAEIWRRHVEVAPTAVHRAYFASQWRRMRNYERAACTRWFDHVVAVSEGDADHFRREYGAPSVSAVPTGVDIEYFQPVQDIARQPANLVFTGSMDWMPNVDGIEFFVAEVLPLIRARIPGVTLTIVGRDPHPRVRACAAVPGVEVTGSVPDVRPYLRRGSVFVVPLRVGGGTRLKIYEAMAMECPVVSTRIGAEGLPLEAGTHILLEDEAAGFAEACRVLLEDPARARRQATVAADHVRTHFSWDGVAAVFEDACRSAIDRRNGPAPSGTGTLTARNR